MYFSHHEAKEKHDSGAAIFDKKGKDDQVILLITIIFACFSRISFAPYFLRQTMLPATWCWLFALLVLCSCSTSAHAKTVKHQWALSPLYNAPDGHYRMSYVVNGTSPGPVLVGDEGDDFEVTIMNQLPVEMTVHWWVEIDEAQVYRVTLTRCDPLGTASFNVTRPRWMARQASASGVSHPMPTTRRCSVLRNEQLRVTERI